MDEPLAVELSIVTHVHGDHVEHRLELAESSITVSIDRDITPRHQAELLATLDRLLPLMERLWAEEPEHGSLFIVDLRQAME